MVPSETDRISVELFLGPVGACDTDAESSVVVVTGAAGREVGATREVTARAFETEAIEAIELLEIAGMMVSSMSELNRAQKIEENDSALVLGSVESGDATRLAEERERPLTST